MKVSIALATYNGEQYLEEQLDSFLRQTRLPDELVICDDGSTDNTASIVEAFSKRAPFSVRFEKNPENIGYSRNFEKCISLCTGDIIFLSDQDDVWLPEKVSRVEGEFAARPECEVVINDQLITDENLRSTGQTIFENTRKLGFDEEWLSAGCCTAISKEFAEVALPMPSSLVAHDGWIHRLASSLGVRVVINEVLQYYRRHSTNTSHSLALRASKFPFAEVYREFGLRSVELGWLNEVAIAERVMDACERELEKGAISKRCLVNAIATEDRRARMLSRRIEIVRIPRFRRWYAVCTFYLERGYAEFSGFRSAIKDVLRP